MLVDASDLLLEMHEPFEQLVPDQVVDRAKVLSAEPVSAARPERGLVRRQPVVPRQDKAQADLYLGQRLREPAPVSRQLPQALVTGLRDVRQWNLAQA